MTTGKGQRTQAKGAAHGAKPAGVITQRTTAMVTITAFDLAARSVTFKGPQGNTATIRVQHPEKLKEVPVGDMVEIAYTEAFAIKLEETANK